MLSDLAICFCSSPGRYVVFQMESVVHYEKLAPSYSMKSYEIHGRNVIGPVCVVGQSVMYNPSLIIP